MGSFGLRCVTVTDKRWDSLMGSMNFVKFILSFKHTGHRRSQFGRGQIITVGDWWNPSVNQADHPSKVLWAGSDPRGDGCAQGY